MPKIFTPGNISLVFAAIAFSLSMLSLAATLAPRTQFTASGINAPRPCQPGFEKHNGLCVRWNDAKT